MPNINIDKTKNHFHTDPKLIEQTNVSNDLLIGQLVYLDEDGLYKPAIATDRLKSNIQGIVWSFIGKNQFYLSMEPKPLFYRFPFIPNWFSNDFDGLNENAPLYSQIPAPLGHKVYLSESIPGGMSATPPSDIKLTVIVGYRTEYGLLYRPEPFCCGIDWEKEP